MNFLNIQLPACPENLIIITYELCPFDINEKIFSKILCHFKIKYVR